MASPYRSGARQRLFSVKCLFKEALIEDGLKFLDDRSIHVKLIFDAYPINSLRLSEH